MIFLVLVFFGIMLSSGKDKYQYAVVRKKSKRLPKGGEYTEVIARYVKGK